MNTAELIRKKRDGKSLLPDEINFLISGYTKNKIPDYQFSAFLMAAFLKGLNKEETSALTEAMLFSGKIADLKSVKGIKIDKHSTGGVGDKTSLIIAPIAAAAGVYVPMISGRSLGHTGGTLDKLESIPGFRTNLSLKDYKKILKKCGLVLIGQTIDIAPADKLIYSLRDVTATVESIPLITASIMSKKLAEGIDGLVLDVKTGSGAFMKKKKEAKILAEFLKETAERFGKKVIVFITDMNQPLGNYIGNWLEVYESLKILKGEIKNDLYELSLKLAGAMIFLGGKSSSIKEGEKIAEDLIDNGEAYKKFAELVACQKGDIKVIENPDSYPNAKFSKNIYAWKSGYINFVNNYETGMAAVELGAGRKTKEDLIDPSAGIIFHKKTGDFTGKNELIAQFYSNKSGNFVTAEKRIFNSVVITGNKIKKPKLIKEIIQ